MIKDTEDIYKEGFFSDDKNKAIHLFDEVIRQNPKHHRAWRYRGLRKAEIGFEVNNKEYILEGAKEIKLSIAMAEKEGIDTFGVKTSLDEIEKKLASM